MNKKRIYMLLFYLGLVFSFGGIVLVFIGVNGWGVLTAVVGVVFAMYMNSRCSAF